MPFKGDCGNDLDDDSDCLVDAADPGCQNGAAVGSSADPTQRQGGRNECINGVDDDGDGLFDGDDLGCINGLNTEFD